MSDSIVIDIKQQTRDLSGPNEIRINLCCHFRKRISHLQHLKYKMLTRYAHFSQNSINVDRIGIDVE